jgi:hypothetical protein
VKNQKLFQAVGEAIIPLLGFFFFNWGLYFILLFFFIDLLSTELFLHIKANAILSKNKREVNSRITRLKYGLISFLFTLILIVTSHMALFFVQPEIDFLSAFYEFLLYEEMGIPIPQGVILFPLVFLGNYMQFKQFFQATRQAELLSITTLFSRRIKAIAIGIAGCGIVIGSSLFFLFPTSIYLLLLVGIKFFVDYRMR